MPKRRRERSKTPEVQWETLPDEAPAAPVAIIRSRQSAAKQQDPPAAPRELEPLPKIDHAAAKALERDNWRALVGRLAALRKDPVVEALLKEKHKEIQHIPDMCGARGEKTLTLDQARESVKGWFERGLKGSNRQGPAERANLCKICLESLEARAKELCNSGSNRVAEAMERGKPEEEGPLVCSMLSKELQGSSYEGLWISFLSPGHYLLGDDHEGNGLPPHDQDGAKIPAPVKVVVRVTNGRLRVEGFYHPGEDTPNRAKVNIGPFLSVYFEGMTLKDAMARWKGAMGQEALAAGGSGVEATHSNRSKSPSESSNGKHDALKALSAQLPPGWEIRESRSKKGVYYYANPSKGVSQLERPTR